MQTSKGNLLLAIAVALVLGQGYARAQDDWMNEKFKRIGVSPVTYRKHLAVDFSNVGELKIAVKKGPIVIGEIVSFEIVLRNRSKMPVYFRNLNKFITVEMYNSHGERIPLSLYGIPDFLPAPSNYDLVFPKDSVSTKIHLKIGCGPDVEHPFSVNKNKQLKKNVMPEGRGCFDVKSTGDFQIRSEITNDLVVIRETKFKTAVGLLEGNNFKIQIAGVDRP